MRLGSSSNPAIFALIAAALLQHQTAGAQGKIGAEYPHHVDFAVLEESGVDRENEPVRIEFPFPAGVTKTGACMLIHQGKAKPVPLQCEAAGDGHRFQILFLASQAAGSRASYRLYFGARTARSESADALKVSGDDLAWRVENRFLIADFTPNPGTGRSGQLNKIFLKNPGIWLSRERPQSTLHLSPNAAGSEHYVPVNRWNPPDKWRVCRGPLSFRLEREGPMPKMPELLVRVVYEVFAGSGAIAVEEQFHATRDVDVSLLRVGEFTFAPDPQNPFTHIAWAQGDEFAVRPRFEVPPLTMQIPWMAFISARSGFAFASVLEKLDLLPTGSPAPLLNQASSFGGRPPHYFFRSFIAPAGESDSRMLKVAAGSTYFIRHWIYTVTWAGDTEEKLARRISDFARKVRAPLRCSTL